MSEKENPNQIVSISKFKPPFCYYCGEKVDEDFQEGYERVAHGDCIDAFSDDLSWEVLS